jgi:UDP-glucose 4-epimerase
MLSEKDVDGIIHFAALKAVGESVSDPLAYYRNNVDSILCALESMRAHGIPNIIFSSSATVYGEADAFPVTEETPRKPSSSPYGNTKQICEDILCDTVRSGSFPLRGIALRYFNPIGAHPSGHIGELPIGTPANLVPFLVQATSGKRGPLTIYGNDYPTPDGTGVRDYIHVMDLAEAHVTALEYLLKSSRSDLYDVFNVGTGRPTSVKELIASFEETTGAAVPHAYGPRRPGDVAESWADVSKIRKIFGWESKRSVEEALADAWRWENRNNRTQ